MEEMGPGLCSSKFKPFQAGHIPEDQAAQWEGADLTSNPGVLKPWVCLPSAHRRVCLGVGVGLLLQVGGTLCDSGGSLPKGMVPARVSRRLSAVVDKGLGLPRTGGTVPGLLSVEGEP